jgi:hypothetical protein
MDERIFESEIEHGLVIKTRKIRSLYGYDEFFQLRLSTLANATKTTME